MRHGTRLSLLGLAVIAVFPGRAFGAVDGSGQATDVSDALGDLAVKMNPGVLAIEARVEALEQRVQQARAWMDPMFSAEYSSMPIDHPTPGQHPMSGIQFMLRQTFYWPGKIGAREDEAKRRVKQEQLSLGEKEVQLRATVKHAYYRLALTRQSRKLTRRHVKLLGDFLNVVRIKVETGVAAQHELLRLRVLVGQLKDDLKTFDRDESALTAAINATLHRPLGVAVPTPDETAVPEPTGDAASLAGQAERERPLLKRFAAEAETHRSAARRAEREGYPDITLWGGYRIRTEAGSDRGTDFASLGVSLPLPLSYRGRWASQARQNEKLAESAMREREAALDRIRGELGGLVADWKRSAQKARTYRQELIPEARLGLDATFAAYRVGRADFASLYQAELDLLNVERATLMAATAAAEARVAVEAMVGSGVK